MAGYAVIHLDEIDELVDGRCHYRPVRHHLGITSFGATAWTVSAAGDLVIDEHDEGDPTADEELFVVLRGHAVFELDGDRVDAPAGTLVFARPHTKRRALAEQAGTSIFPTARLVRLPRRAFDQQDSEAASTKTSAGS
jgi:hypothetical protein